MFKRIALLGLIASRTCGLSAPPKQPKKMVAWDIHRVLFTAPKRHGYQCKPQESTFELVRKLKDNGVKQVILSNISNESFCKLSRCYPDHFEHFDIGESLTGAKLFFRKPQKRYYKKFLRMNPNVDPNDIIFFDDKPENVKGARNKCIDGQIFCSAAQAHTILNRKGLL